MDQEYTRTGARRSGDDYQDIIALDVFVEWLEHPERFQHIRVEADDAGFLDDVVALQADGTYRARQVKFSTHPDDPDDPWTWDDWLTSKPGKRGPLPSLLTRWAKSLDELTTNVTALDAAVVSNRKASPEIAGCIDPTGFIDYTKAAPEDQQAIIGALGDATRASAYFGRLRFELDRPDIDTYEDGVWKRFERLGGTHYGWLHLKDKLRAWIRNKNLPTPQGFISLSDIKSAALWSIPRALLQEFPVPTDYVSPSQEFDRAVRDRIADTRQTCIAISASPGVGKSTYLSALFRELLAADQPVLRHHYFLSRDDRRERFDHTRVLESLMSDIEQRYPEALSALPARNPTTHEFGNWLSKLGEHFAGLGQRVIIIIDGLDHVWRDTTSALELELLFEKLLPAPAGVVIMVGTQPVADEALSRHLLRFAPRKTWMHIPCLDESAVQHWLEHHQDALDLPDSAYVRDDCFDRLTHAFYEKTKGHPLHLRYTFEALREQGISITAEHVQQSPGCPHQNINDYYAELWSGLSDGAKDMVLLFAACNFPWRESWLFECLDPEQRATGTITGELRRVRHLLTPTPEGLSPFHSSLAAYLGTRDDYAEVILVKKAVILKWIQTSAPKFLRLTFEWLLESDLGNSGSLLNGPSRQWILDVLRRGLVRQRVERVLQEAMRVVLNNGDFARHAELGLLLDYFGDTQDYYDEQRDELLPVQLRLEDQERFLDLYMQAHLPELRLRQLATLADYHAEQGNQTVVDQCFDVLQNRISKMGVLGKNEDYSDWDSSFAKIIRVAALATTTNAKRLANFAIQFRDVGRSYDVLETYAEQLRIWKRVAPLQALAGLSLNSIETRAVIGQLVLCAFEQRFSLASLVKLSEHAHDPFVTIYAALHAVEDFPSQAVEFPDSRIFVEPRYSNNQLPLDLAQSFRLAFFACLANHLSNHATVNQTWIATLRGTEWMRSFLEVLNAIASYVSQTLRADSSPSIAEMYTFALPLDAIEQESRHFTEGFPFTVYKVLRSIIFDVLTLFTYQGKPIVISKEDITSVIENPFFRCEPWIQEYVLQRRMWLSNDAAAFLLDRQSHNLATMSDEFPNRVTSYIALAKVGYQHGLLDRAHEFFRLASDNFFAYGHHKDMLLHGCLETLKTCQAAGLPKTHEWLFRLAPAFVFVREFTDGDETGHLPEAFSDLLADVDPVALQNHYLWLCEHQRLSRAEHAFAAIVRSMNLADAVNVATASTSVDDKSLEALRARAAGGDTQASKAAESLRDIADAPPPSASASTPYPESQNSLPDKPALPSLDTYQAHELRRYLDDTRNHHSDMPLFAWIEYWSAKGQLTVLLQTLQEERRRDKWRQKGSDHVYGIVKAQLGTTAAFPWLVRAHNDARGWYAYWSSAEDSKRRQIDVVTTYPEQTLQFLKETLGEQYGVYRSPVRLIEYLLLIGQADLACQITECVVSFAVEMVSPVSLPKPDWLHRDVNSLELRLKLLLSRLAWPSVMARDYACRAIAQLLQETEVAASVTQALLRWMAAQSLETDCGVALLPLLCAKVRTPSTSIPEVDDVLTHLTAPSLYASTLVHTLYEITLPSAKWEERHAPDAPDTFVEPAFFSKYGKSFIMPIHWYYAEQLQKHENVSFLRQWAFEWQCLLERLGITPDMRVLDFRGFRASDDHHSLCDFRLSEVYRSAFLRTLHWAYHKGVMSEQDAYGYSLNVCPILPDLWHIPLDTAPVWWPRVTETRPDLDLTSTEILKAVETLWHEQEAQGDGWRIVQASGRICELDTTFDLEIYGLFQACMGSNQPELEEIADACRYEEIVYPQHMELGLSGRYKYSGSRDVMYHQFGDWKVLPVAVHLRTLFYPWWQHWRVRRDLWLPTPYLSHNGLDASIDEGQLVARDGIGVFGKWTDWTFQLQELSRANLSSSTGQCLYVKAERVYDFEAGERVNFCWLVRLTGYHRKYTSEDFESYTFTVVHGAQTIIVPRLLI